MKYVGLDLRIEGVLIEKFINNALASGIVLYNTKREGNVLKARVSLRDFYRLRPVARGARCHVYIQKRRGIFSLNIKYRFMLIIGMLLCIAAVSFAQTRIFLIDIDGDSGYEAAIIDELENLGIFPGVAKRDADISALENELITRVPELAWVSMEISGMKLRVNIAPGVQPPEIIDRHTPSNLVADRDAMVVNIETYSGTPEVKPGDTVKAGQVLISGYESSFGGGANSVRAIGVVTGKIAFEGYGETPVYEETRTPTGRVAAVRSLRVFDRYFRLDSLPEFENYDKTVRYLGFTNLIPVGEVVEEFSEVMLGFAPRDGDKAKGEALILAEIDAYKQLPEEAEVVDKRLNFSIIEDSRLCATVYVEAVLGITKEMTR